MEKDGPGTDIVQLFSWSGNMLLVQSWQFRGLSESLQVHARRSFVGSLNLFFCPLFRFSRAVPLLHIPLSCSDVFLLTTDTS